MNGCTIYGMQGVDEIIVLPSFEELFVEMLLHLEPKHQTLDKAVKFVV